VVWTVVTSTRYPLLLIVALIGLAILYRYAPSRHAPWWQRVRPGALVATVFWLIGSVAFSIYVQNVGSYNVHRAARRRGELRDRASDGAQYDGRPKPRGERGAYAAAAVGEQP
jgi:hypothetical protein